ncbi:hypothetical protein KKF34_06975 [Myxococcota bacterium]|nr:hypothetical protein [Myxococcota bacterium]MBU1382945.1 hypothetical protein [Myxococcota bacterium]MBU1496604.1 hypothetical protein [Myxococcota bacterium]
MNQNNFFSSPPLLSLMEGNVLKKSSAPPLCKMLSKKKSMKMELIRVMDNCTYKRKMFLKKANKIKNGLLYLNISTAILSLLSAGTITVILTNITSAFGLQIFAAICSFSAGIIGIFSNIIFKKEDGIDYLVAASKYLVLREKVNALLIRDNEKQMNKELDSLHKEYCDIEKQFFKC